MDAEVAVRAVETTSADAGGTLLEYLADRGVQLLEPVEISPVADSVAVQPVDLPGVLLGLAVEQGLVPHELGAVGAAFTDAVSQPGALHEGPPAELSAGPDGHGVAAGECGELGDGVPVLGGQGFPPGLVLVPGGKPRRMDGHARERVCGWPARPPRGNGKI